MKFTLQTRCITSLQSINTVLMAWLLGCFALPAAYAAEYRVSNTSELQSALSSAASNESGDIIVLTDGTYFTSDNPGGSFVFNDDSGYDLLIKAENRGQAILDGAGQHEILVIKHAQNTGTITLDGLAIRNGTRGARIENASVIVINTEFSHHHLQPGMTGGSGAALYLPTKAESVVISDSVFSDNHALTNSLDSKGGAALINAKAIHISTSQFFNNQALAQGGALWLGSNAMQSLIENCEFEGNKTGPFRSSYGGAIFALNPLQSRNNVFSRNQAVSVANNLSQGGAVFADGSFTSTNDLFSENSAGLGGAVRSDGTVTLLNGVFKANESALKGAALAAVRLSGSAASTVVNTLFIANRGFGTAEDSTLYCHKNCHVVNSLFDNNSTRAAVYFNSGSVSGLNVVANSVFLNTGNLNVQSARPVGQVPRISLANNFMDASQIGTEAEFLYAAGNFYHTGNVLDNHYRAIEGSTLIDNGLTQPALFQLPGVDHDGLSRTAGQAVDVGPYESNSFAIDSPANPEPAQPGVPPGNGDNSGTPTIPEVGDSPEPIGIEDALGASGGSFSLLNLLMLGSLLLITKRLSNTAPSVNKKGASNG